MFSSCIVNNASGPNRGSWVPMHGKGPEGMVKKDDKAKLEEEEVRFSLNYGEPQGGERALRVHQLMLGWSVGSCTGILYYYAQS